MKKFCLLQLVLLMALISVNVMAYVDPETESPYSYVRKMHLIIKDNKSEITLNLGIKPTANKVQILKDTKLPQGIVISNSKFIFDNLNDEITGEVAPKLWLEFTNTQAKKILFKISWDERMNFDKNYGKSFVYFDVESTTDRKKFHTLNLDRENSFIINENNKKMSVKVNPTTEQTRKAEQKFMKQFIEKKYGKQGLAEGINSISCTPIQEDKQNQSLRHSKCSGTYTKMEIGGYVKKSNYNCEFDFEDTIGLSEVTKSECR